MRIIKMIKIYSRVQQGFALISVLIILVVITLLGVTAMRMGLSSLSLANNSQVSHLLFQTADMGTSQLLATASVDLTKALDVDGVLHLGKNVPLCLTPVAGAKYTNLTDAKCDPSNSAHYLSKREVVLTQVSYSRFDPIGYQASNQTKSPSLPGATTGAVLSSVTGLSKQRLRIYSTSVVPSFGSASKTQISDCLSKPSDDDDDPDVEGSNNAVETVTDCLTDAGAVFTTHASEYDIIR